MTENALDNEFVTGRYVYRSTLEMHHSLKFLNHCKNQLYPFMTINVLFHLFGNGGGGLAIGKNYAENVQIGKCCGLKFV